MVITSAPGEEAQVDYGEGPMVRDADSGKYRRTRLFVLTLGYSRKAVRLLVPRSSAQVWAELHERAFRRLGGTVRVVVLDNLKEGVLTPDIYDPTLNPLYRDVLAHYGVVALPCRVGDPDRKGKVEAAVGHAQKTPLRGLRFEQLDVAQAYLDRWERHWTDTRIHGTTKRQVAVMFAEERPALGPLPLGPAAVRRILGVLALARKHGPAVVEQAANAALEFGFPTYRFVRRYLDRRPAPPLSLRQVDPLIRELTFYRDLIDRRTGPSATGTRASQYPRRRRFCYAPCWTLGRPPRLPPLAL